MVTALRVLMAPIGRFVAVVDDDASVARAISRLLRAAGMTVQTFTSSTAFLEQLRTQPATPPACVILDVCMPDVDGLDVQQKLAGLSATVIFITAHDVPEARDKALGAGAVGYLRKPFNATQLIDLVRSTLV